jgi:hypothetical protein
VEPSMTCWPPSPERGPGYSPQLRGGQWPAGGMGWLARIRLCRSTAALMRRSRL